MNSVCTVHLTAVCYRTLKIIVMLMMQYMNLMDENSAEKGRVVVVS